MADEFISPIPPASRVSLIDVASNLCSQGDYFCERSSSDEASFRLTQERRHEWPEDFTLCYDSVNLLATIHCATRQQRENILENVKIVFSQHEMFISFEAV
jgi:hypothetical protein